MPQLSVIVVNWNGRHLLTDCLTSLSSQTLPDLEVILVDNGSSDDSVELVRRDFPHVRLLALDRNHGFAGGNNHGIANSSSPFVALLNNDAVADRHWAERLLAGATDPSVGMAASRVLLAHDAGRLDSAGDQMTTVGVAYKRGHLEAAERYPRTDYVFGASGCAMLLRRAMLDEVGLLDEDFFLIYEDADLCFRAQLRGWKSVYLPEAIVYHKLSTSIGRLSRVHVYYGQRNAEYLYFKNMPGGLFWKYLPAHCLNGILACAYFSSKGRGLDFVKSKIDFLRNFRRVLTKRARIQKKRSVTTREIDRMLDPRWLRSRLAGK